jgi:hypothetical protein
VDNPNAKNNDIPVMPETSMVLYVEVNTVADFRSAG